MVDEDQEAEEGSDDFIEIQISPVAESVERRDFRAMRTLVSGRSLGGREGFPSTTARNRSKLRRWDQNFCCLFFWS